MNVALLSISPASHGQLVKMLILLTTWYIWIKLHTCLFKHCPAIGMHNCHEAAGIV